MTLPRWLDKLLLAFTGTVVGADVVSRLIEERHECPYSDCQRAIDKHVRQCPVCGRPIGWEPRCLDEEK